MEIKFTNISEVIKNLQLGKLVIVVDDVESVSGSLICLAEGVTKEAVNSFGKIGKNAVSVALNESYCRNLNLAYSQLNENTVYTKPFAQSVNYIHSNFQTGISANDRAETIRALADLNSKREKFISPGQIRPLISKEGGVLRRAGQIEAAVDLAVLSNSSPVSAFMKILDDNGELANFNDISKLSEKEDIAIVSVKKLIEYRSQNESLIMREEVVNLPTKQGNFKLHAFREIYTDSIHLALVKGEVDSKQDILVRVHSSCLTGDVLHSLRCDCGEQLEKSLQIVNHAGSGVVLYMNQEGRGIGLINKLKAYKLQEEGLDTVDANLALGFKADERDYGVGAQILKDLGVQKINLISNNPKKRVGLSSFGLVVTKTTPLEIIPSIHNKKYLKTKKEKLFHKLSIS